MEREGRGTPVQNITSQYKVVLLKKPNSDSQKVDLSIFDILDYLDLNICLLGRMMDIDILDFHFHFVVHN